MTIDEKIAVLLAYNKLIELASDEISFYSKMSDNLREKLSQDGEAQPYEETQLERYNENIKAMQMVKEEVEKLALSK